MRRAAFGLALARSARHIRAMNSSPLDPAAASTDVGQRSRAVLMLAALALAACEPTVRLEAPQEPIVINLNVKIEQEVRVKVERELEDVIRQNEELF